VGGGQHRYFKTSPAMTTIDKLQLPAKKLTAAQRDREEEEQAAAHAAAAAAAGELLPLPVFPYR
jgi:hypothetical protein